MGSCNRCSVFSKPLGVPQEPCFQNERHLGKPWWRRLKWKPPAKEVQTALILSALSFWTPMHLFYALVESLEMSFFLRKSFASRKEQGQTEGHLSSEGTGETLFQRAQVFCPCSLNENDTATDEKTKAADKVCVADLWRIWLLLGNCHGSPLCNYLCSVLPPVRIVLLALALMPLSKLMVSFAPLSELHNSSLLPFKDYPPSWNLSQGHHFTAVFRMFTQTSHYG